MLKRILSAITRRFRSAQPAAPVPAKGTPPRSGGKVPSPPPANVPKNPAPPPTHSKPRSERPPRNERHVKPGPERPAFNPTSRPPRPERDRPARPPRSERPSDSPIRYERLPVPPMPEIIAPEPEEGKVSFHDLGLRPEILAAIQELGFKTCTPVQEQAIPALMNGRDIVGKSQTGTGKTAAFLAAIFHRFLENPRPERLPGTCRALVLAPTRELAIQIHKDAEVLGKFCGFRNLVVFGGMDHQKQLDAIRTQALDILIGTPGRLIDYMQGRYLRLEETEILVIDEADRMLDMGFIPDVTRIVSKLPPPGTRQTFFFSATFTPEVMRLTDRWLSNPVQVEIESEHVVTGLINQRFYSVLREQKFPLLMWIIRNEPFTRMLIFGNRRDFNTELANKLRSAGVEVELLSGDVPQEKRLKVLERFRTGKTPVLVATDVAARGIHVDGISHVINYDLPEQPEDYVHRIGRTGRAGTSGDSVSFICEYGAYAIEDIEKYIGNPIISIQPEDEMVAPIAGIDSNLRPPRRPRSDNDRGGHGRPRPGGHSAPRPGARRR